MFASLMTTMSILSELDGAFPFEFETFFDGVPGRLALGAPEDTPLRFTHAMSSFLRVEMNYELLRPWILPVMEALDHRVGLNVPSLPDSRLTFPRDDGWVLFDVTPQAYQADWQVYLNILHYVLSLHLLERGMQALFDA